MYFQSLINCKDADTGCQLIPYCSTGSGSTTLMPGGKRSYHATVPMRGFCFTLQLFVFLYFLVLQYILLTLFGLIYRRIPVIIQSHHLPASPPPASTVGHGRPEKTGAESSLVDLWQVIQL
jgi:hypothetical protein